MDPEADSVLDFWFGPAARDPNAARERNDFWFGSSVAADNVIRERYLVTIEAAARGDLDDWLNLARSSLALVVVLDQFPRNAYRGTARAFAYDSRALAVARAAVNHGHLEELAPIEGGFLILPFQHDESLESQRESVRLSGELVERAPAAWQATMAAFLLFAEQHLAAIERFGRYPHRNRILGRLSTPEEEDYLRRGGVTYGQG